MMYLVSQLWVWLLLALIIGLVVGWLTCSREPTRWWLGWVPWGTVAFLIGLFLAVLRVFPGRLGYLLDSALLMFASYLIGCCIGCLIKQWLSRNEVVLATSGAAAVAPHGAARAAQPQTPVRAASAPAPAAKQAAAPRVVTPPPPPPPPPAVPVPPPAAPVPPPAASVAAASSQPAKPAAPVMVKPTPPVSVQPPAAPPVAAPVQAKPVPLTPEPLKPEPPKPAPIAAAPMPEPKPAAAAAAPTPTPAPAAPVQLADPLPPEPVIDLPAGLPGRRPRGYATPIGGKADDLKRIRGIGKQNEGRLHALGIWHFRQIAEWVREEIDWVGSYLAFPGRIDRESWVSQAKVLAEGGETDFSKRVDRGEVSTSVDQGDKGQANVASLGGITNATSKPRKD